jgi:magnesium chelatase accessory protein
MRQSSSFVEAAGTRYHVQQAGPPDAPVFLLIHGTGASTHSMSGLLAELSAHYRVVSLDLPGHGFTDTRGLEICSLGQMAAAVLQLLQTLGLAPAFAAGHSAGAAILLEMERMRGFHPRRIFGINSALEPIPGNALFSPVAKFLAMTSMAPRFFSWQARHGGVANLLASTGTQVPGEMKRCYEILFANPAHVAGALCMMANWDLSALRAAMPKTQTPVCLIACGDDPMVSAEVSRRAAGLLANGEFVRLDSGGHLVHEAAPQRAAEEILRRCG